MTVTKSIETADVGHVLSNLVGRDVRVAEAEGIEPHAATLRGLVTNENVLSGVIGGNLAFAHTTGAALAMIPAGAVEDAGDEPNEMWLEFYTEVANVLSRVVNEAASVRLRIDPGITHSPEDLDAIIATGSVIAFTASVDGYGDSQLAFWATV